MFKLTMKPYFMGQKNFFDNIFFIQKTNMKVTYQLTFPNIKSITFF